DVERLHPKTIPRDDQRALAGVPPGHGEHPAHARERRRAILDEQSEQHFRVAARRKLVSARFEIAAQLAVVVDLSVEDDVVPAVRGRDRLVSVWSGIDDGETTMDEEHVMLDRQPGP